MDVLQRLNATTRGRPDGRPMVFVHGFGCDQSMWRHVAPAFEGSYRTVLYDQVGCGGSDLSAYDARRYARLEAYAEDLAELLRALDLRDAVLVGHSVGATVAALAALEEPGRVTALALVAPSPRYTDDGDYVGGSTREAVEELLEALDANYLGWSSVMAPAIVGADHP